MRPVVSNLFHAPVQGPHTFVFGLAGPILFATKNVIRRTEMLLPRWYGLATEILRAMIPKAASAKRILVVEDVQETREAIEALVMTGTRTRTGCARFRASK